MTFLEILTYGITPVLVFVVLMGFVRLLVGPSISDRVVALEMLTTVAIGIIVVFAIETDETSLLDVAMVLALTTFLSTIAFANYIQGQDLEKGDAEE